MLLDLTYTSERSLKTPNIMIVPNDQFFSSGVDGLDNQPNLALDQGGSEIWNSPTGKYVCRCLPTFKLYIVHRSHVSSAQLNAAKHVELCCANKLFENFSTTQLLIMISLTIHFWLNQ